MRNENLARFKIQFCSFWAMLFLLPRTFLDHYLTTFCLFVRLFIWVCFSFCLFRDVRWCFLSLSFSLFLFISHAASKDSITLKRLRSKEARITRFRFSLATLFNCGWGASLHVVRNVDRVQLVREEAIPEVHPLLFAPAVDGDHTWKLKRVEQRERMMWCQERSQHGIASKVRCLVCTAICASNVGLVMLLFSPAFAFVNEMLPSLNLLITFDVE